ncbi:S41 family peptidase [Candidatus Oscillochloris fontis]|uniref:S41 family peptidase n=1 Tax=Candidatus Oscillochloris fontis TaxID=2496868 RepID=UPI00101D402B|nr:S41 family peptidase [Candidatus Oscillochloris fontis]
MAAPRHDLSPLTIARWRVPLWLVSLLLVVAVATGVLVGILGNNLLSKDGTCPESPAVCAEFTAFWDAWRLTRANFVDAEAIDTQLMIDGAINGMLDTLGDQGHTRYMGAEQATEWDEALRGSFEGIGAYIDVRDGQTIIVNPIPGSPAEAAGLLPGDAILAVDGDPTTGWSVDQLASRVRGPAGSQVTLRIRHADTTEVIEVTITRAKVVVPSVSWRMLPDQIALIRLTAFDGNSGSQMREAIQAARDAGAKAMILDLRNNSGGLLNEMVSIASQFLPEGTTVLLEEDRAGKREPTRTVAGGVALDLPLVVLINRNSASSAEILAGAIQDAERASLIGETTFGTGTVLSSYRIIGGGRLLLGTKQWLTPSGQLIRGQGINPDEEVVLPSNTLPLSPTDAAALSIEQLLAAEDTQMARAVELMVQAIP